MRNNLIRTDVLTTVSTNNYYKKPVEEITSKISNSNRKRVIVSGVKGGGKSTVLYHHRNALLYTGHENIIGTFHDSIPFFGINELFSAQYYEYFYELEMSLMLLSQIKLFYSNIFNQEFANLYEEIEERLKELKIYTRISNKEQKNLKEFLPFGSLTEPIIRKFKNEASLFTLSLEIDQFEYNSLYHQLNLVNYSELFDQIILAVNSSCVTPDLKNKGYEIINVDYGKNYEVLREILKQKIISYNVSIAKSEETFPFNLVTDKLIESLAQISNGNISIVLDALYLVNETLSGSKNMNLETLITYLQREIAHNEKIEEMYPTKKLHL